MKTSLLKTLAAILASAAAQIASADAPKGYLAFPIEDVREKYSYEKDKPEGTEYLDAWVFAKEADNGGDIEDAAMALISADEKTVVPLLKDPKEAAKALKYIKFGNFNKDSFDDAVAVQLGQFYALIFPIPEGSKLRRGMNIMVFEKSGEKYLWDVSFADPILPLLATSDFRHASSAHEPDFFSTADEITVNKLERSALPFLCFKNGVLLSTQEVERVYAEPSAKFYHKAQEIFYSWRLDDYADFMTKASREKFNGQFGSMDEKKKKETLSEYFKWTKVYRKVLDAGKYNIILFSRHKEGEDPYYDCAYLLALPDDGWAIAKFSAEKSPLDIFLAKYIYPKRDYFLSISQKFIEHPRDER